MVFCFVQKFFFGQRKSQNIIFFVAQSANVFFQNLTLGYMTKTLNQIIFFPPPNSEYFFQQHWESEYVLRKKNITPHPPFKLNGRSLASFFFFHFIGNLTIKLAAHILVI